MAGHVTTQKKDYISQFSLKLGVVKWPYSGQQDIGGHGMYDFQELSLEGKNVPFSSFLFPAV